MKKFKYNSVIRIRIEKDLREDVMSYCKKIEMPLSVLIRGLIREELSKYDQEFWTS